MKQVGSNFGERSKNEAPVGQLGMRQGKRGRFQNEAVDQQQVEIEGAGTLGNAGGMVPAEGAFDCQQAFEQTLGVLVGAQVDGGVDECGLVLVTNRRGSI